MIYLFWFVLSIFRHFGGVDAAPISDSDFGIFAARNGDVPAPPFTAVVLVDTSDPAIPIPQWCLGGLGVTRRRPLKMNMRLCRSPPLAFNQTCTEWRNVSAPVSGSFAKIATHGDGSIGYSVEFSSEDDEALYGAAVARTGDAFNALCAGPEVGQKRIDPFENAEVDVVYDSRKANVVESMGNNEVKRQARRVGDSIWQTGFRAAGPGNHDKIMINEAIVAATNKTGERLIFCAGNLGGKSAPGGYTYCYDDGPGTPGACTPGPQSVEVGPSPGLAVNDPAKSGIAHIIFNPADNQQVFPFLFFASTFTGEIDERTTAFCRDFHKMH